MESVMNAFVGLNHATQFGIRKIVCWQYGATRRFYICTLVILCLYTPTSITTTTTPTTTIPCVCMRSFSLPSICVSVCHVFFLLLLSFLYLFYSLLSCWVVCCFCWNSFKRERERDTYRHGSFSSSSSYICRMSEYRAIL